MNRAQKELAAWLQAVQGFGALHWACESGEPARVLAALQEGSADLAARAGEHGQGATALELLTGSEVGPLSPLSPALQLSCFAAAALDLRC